MIFINELTNDDIDLNKSKRDLKTLSLKLNVMTTTTTEGKLRD